MTRLRALGLSLIIQLFGLSAGWAVEIVYPSEVPSGTRGICLTEMDGGEMVEIPLTVLGTVGPSAPEREIVLVRLDDPRFEKTGIIAGMSGSPVYVDGKLLGALAFGWAFSKEPIGGVTPFARMLQLGPGAGDQSGGGLERPQLGDVLSAWREGRLDQLLVDWLAPKASGEFRHLPLSLSMGGWPTLPNAGWLAESWRRLGWVDAPGGGGGGAVIGDDLVPGAMVGAVLADGDANLGAGGTVTEVRGDQVWAFGHPFLWGGDVQIPMARARVVTVLPSLYNSFKLFTMGEIVGTVRADRAHGVWGRIGPGVPMVPVSVSVDGRDYGFRSVRHEALFPMLAGYLVYNSLAARGRTAGEQTVELAVDLEYASGRVAHYEESFVGAEAAVEAAGMVAAAVAYLENSQFEVPEIEGLRVRLASAERLNSTTLVSATPQRWVVRPGEPLHVRLRLRPHRGDEYFRDVVVPVPDSVAEGRLDLIVADGASWSVYDLQMRPHRAASFDHDLRVFDRIVPSRRVVLALERREPGVALSGGTLSLPPSVAAQMRSGLGTGLQTTEYGVVSRVEEEMPTSVLGAERLRLSVRVEDWEDR